MTAKVLQRIRAIRDRGNYNLWELPDYSMPVIRAFHDNAPTRTAEQRREDATANIQMRILQRLVNYANRDPWITRHIETSVADWQQLVETINVAE